MNQYNLQKAYSRQNWQNWLMGIFDTQIQFETQAESVEIDCDNIKSIQRFASVKLADEKTLLCLILKPSQVFKSHVTV